MVRRDFIERVRRFIYGDQPSSDASITEGLVNNYLNDAIAIAAKANYKDSLAIDGINYVNNSFYTTFKGLEITEDEQFIWKIELPEIPVGIGASEGISTLIIKDTESRQLSYSVIWLSQNQKSFARSMREIPNKLVAYSEGQNVYIESTITLSDFTAQATMISGGLSTDLGSTLNVPPDYFPIMMEYLKQQLMFERNVPLDNVNDGLDAIKTT